MSQSCRQGALQCLIMKIMTKIEMRKGENVWVKSESGFPGHQDKLVGIYYQAARSARPTTINIIINTHQEQNQQNQQNQESQDKT